MSPVVDLDKAYCDQCGESSFDYKGPTPFAHWTKWDAAFVRTFIRDSRCTRCGGRPIAPIPLPVIPGTEGGRA